MSLPSLSRLLRLKLIYDCSGNVSDMYGLVSVAKTLPISMALKMRSWLPSLNHGMELRRILESAISSRTFSGETIPL